MRGNRVDFFGLGGVTFEEPDMETFQGLRLAYQALEQGGSMPTVYNAANEKAVALFLDRRIGYLRIPELIRRCMEHHTVVESPDVDQILAAEQSVYDYIGELV